MHIDTEIKTYKKLELYIFHYIFLNSQHPLLLIYQVALLNLGDAHKQWITYQIFIGTGWQTCSCCCYVRSYNPQTVCRW